MEVKELNFGKEVGSGNSKWGSDGFIDRSKVRILLCDNDSKSADEVFTLLLKCSYQVTAVRSARQVIDALNAEGPDIDIILAEVDLPMTKGMKMLKYIMRDKALRRIPVIMMSAQDEVSVVVKCLRLGAADYLVKPLRTNELLNLWTHMWRRRRMLGLADKNILNYDLDIVASDPSDANTNSTTFFSDDTDDKSKRSINPDAGMPSHQRNDSTAAETGAATEQPITVDHCPDIPGISDRRTEQFSSCPRKSELRIGESSAFFSYVKSSKSSTQAVANVGEDAVQHPRLEEKSQACQELVMRDTHHQQCEYEESRGNCSPGDDLSCSHSVPGSLSAEKSPTPPAQTELPQQRNYKEDKFCQVLVHPRNEPQLDVSGLPAQTAYPFYMSGMMNQVIMPSSAQIYQKNLHVLQNHPASIVIPQYNHIQQGPHHINGMPSFPYYPVSVCMQPGQMSTAHHAWSSLGGPSSSEQKMNKIDRREAALIKFRQKRKERCFDKKIRYVNRKRLAERRPRVRGQFVRKVNGVNVDLNGQPAADYDDYDEEDDDNASRDTSPEDDTSGY